LTSARLELLPSGCERLPYAPDGLCGAVIDGVTVGITPTRRITDDWRSASASMSLHSELIRAGNVPIYFMNFFKRLFLPTTDWAIFRAGSNETKK
jgi:hypothetical protein